MLDPKIKEYLDQNKQKHLDSLFEMLRFPSIANIKEPDGCLPCANWLRDYMLKIGMHAEVLPSSEDGTHQPCVFGELIVDPSAPTVLLYGHYDVQPADPLELWKSPPFQPEIREDYMYGRGTSDDKGQLFMHLMAIEAYQAVGKLPVNVKCIFEGEEEIGSPTIEWFMQQNADKLKADALIISDTGFYADGVPSIVTALRGVFSCELYVTGPNRDVHSGMEGGIITNPLNALAKMVSGMHDQNGKITLPGFYDGVVEPAQDELDAWQKLPFNQEEYAKELGVPTLAGGEKNYSPVERNWSRPTLDVNGLTGGYQGPGDKTVIASKASAKITMRLVPGQEPEKIRQSMREYIQANTPEGVTAEIVFRSGNKAVLLDIDTPAMRAGKRAMEDAFGTEAYWVRAGASVPITETFQRVLGLNAVMLGVGLGTDNLHSPNERFKIEHFYKGAAMIASALDEMQKECK